MSGRWRQSANPIRRKQEANRGWGRKRIEIRIVSQGTVAGHSFRNASTGKNYSGLSQDWGKTRFFVA
jgi:hypothetical protein